MRVSVCPVGIYIYSELKGNFQQRHCCVQIVLYIRLAAQYIRHPHTVLPRHRTLSLFCNVNLKSSEIVIILFQLSMLFAPNQATTKLLPRSKVSVYTALFNWSYFILLKQYM